MWLRLRQIALVADKLAGVETDIIDVLGVKVCYRDPGVARFGLENVLIPIGNQLLEVVAPIQDDTAGGRYLIRRGGNGGYMVIMQCDDHAPRIRRVNELGIRMVTYHEGREFRNMQLHPKDTGGSFLEIDEQVGPDAHQADGAWEPAGKNWRAGKSTSRVTAIAAAEVQCDDPAVVAARWSAITQIPLTRAQGFETLVVENASVRFVPCEDGRPEGLGAIDVVCADRAAVLAAGASRNAVTGPSQVTLCGIRINLV